MFISTLYVLGEILDNIDMYFHFILILIIETLQVAEIYFQRKQGFCNSI